MARFIDGFDLFVFDLDGTLADTLDDLTASVNHALAALGRSTLPRGRVAELVGHGARRLLEGALGPGAPPTEVSRALELFLKHYGAACRVESRLYPGAVATLEGLRTRKLAVLTNKPIAPTRIILAGLGIEHYFASVIGGDSGTSRKPQPDGLLRLMEELGAPPQRTLLVGDSAVDVETARAAGARSALVAHGFQPEAGRAAGPDFEIPDLVALLGESRELPRSSPAGEGSGACAVG